MEFLDASISIPALGIINYDLAYGGAYYAIVKGEDVGLNGKLSKMSEFVDIGMNIKEMLSNVMPNQKKRRKVSVSEARNILLEMEADSLLDQDEMKNEAARRRAVRKNRMLESKLVQYKKTLRGMKRQLSEMNLFNAKLLYANKLMQNRNLSQKQQRAIVEALDNAKTLREAKLLYKSLTASLNKGKTRSLREGKTLRTLGASSRSTRSAQPASSGVEVDRWAVLAGIAGNK